MTGYVEGHELRSIIGLREVANAELSFGRRRTAHREVLISGALRNAIAGALVEVSAAGISEVRGGAECYLALIRYHVRRGGAERRGSAP